MILELQPGDIILYKGKSIISKLIMFFTKSKYSHVSMVFSDGYIIEANWYKKSDIVKFKYNHKIMEIYRYKNGLNPQQQISLIQDSYEFLNKYYDYPQIFWFLIEFFIGKTKIDPLNSSDKLICSELVDRAYSNINIDLVKYRKRGNTTPEDISRGIMELEFERIA